MMFSQTEVRINQEASPFLEILPFFHSSLVKISHILKAMIFQLRVDMFLRPNNEKTTSEFIICVCVYSKYIHLQNISKTNDFRYQISRLFVLLKMHCSVARHLFSKPTLTCPLLRPNKDICIGIYVLQRFFQRVAHIK